MQELLDKAPNLPEDLTWHFIGHLQSNKAKALVGGYNASDAYTVSASTLTCSQGISCAGQMPSQILAWSRLWTLRR